MTTQLSSFPFAWRQVFLRGSWAVCYVPGCGYPPPWEGCAHCLEPSQSQSWATPQTWAMALPFCHQQVEPMACSALYLRWWTYTSSEHYPGCWAGQAPVMPWRCWRRVGLGQQTLYRGWSWDSCLLPGPFTCVISFFLHSSSFSRFLFGSFILGANSNSSSTHEHNVLLSAKLVLRLEGISSLVFTQQHAVNTLLNEGKAKRIRSYNIFPETAAFLILKCFML